MTKASKNAILEAAAKALAWELYAAAAYCRGRASVNVERFERKLSSGLKSWTTTHKNLNRERSKNDGPCTL